MKRSLLLLGLIIFFFIANIAFAAPVGKITYIEGRVDVVKVGKAVATPVSLGDPVDVGDIYRAKSQSKAEIVFINKTVLKMVQNTRVEIQEYTVERDRSIGIIKLYRGKVQAAMTPEFMRRVAAFAEGNKLEIHTPNAVAGVRGTIVGVSYEGGLTWVFCTEGSVYVFNTANPLIVIIVPAGFITSLTGEAPPTTPAMSEKFIINQSMITWGSGAIAEEEQKRNQSHEEQNLFADTTPPIVQMAQTPPPNTNSQTANFLFTADETATYAYSLDGGPWTSTGPLLTMSSLPEGHHTLEVKGTDTSGNTSSIVSYSWVTDYTAPVVSIPTKPPANTNQSTATFGFSVTQPSTLSYKLDGAPSWTPTGLSLPLTSLSEGPHTLQVMATDTVGNSSAPISYSWTTDYTAPVVSIPTKPDPITNQTGATFGFSASETSTYSYRLDGGTWTSTGASLTLSGLSEATHTLDVNATDTAGNPSSTASYSWRTDYTKPVVSIPTKPDPITNQTGATFGFSASETSTYSYRLDGGTWTSTGASLTLSGLSEATHTLDVNATDTAGNPSSTASYSWRTDYTKPVVSIPTKPDPITNQTGATFGFSASETSTYSYRLDGGTWTSTGASLTLSGLSEATHTLDVNATDTAGNPSSTASYSWRTDYTKPVVSIPTKPDPITNQTGATFGFSASETSTYSYRLDGGTWTSTGASLTLSGLSEATHTLDVNATDTAGNPSSTASYSWRTDYTKPVVSIPTKPDPITNQTGATFGFSASETSTYSYRLDGGTWTSTGASLTLSGLSEATHTLDVNATDTAGNPSSTASYSWRTDYTKPVVSIPTKPDPITNQTGATFGFSASETSTYSYRLDGGTWTSTGASLTLSGLSEATHTLDVNATDTAGNPSSTASYSWRTDYTKPVVSIPTKPDPITNQTGATFGFSASETSTYSYRLDGGTWTSTGASLTLSGLSEATHTLDVNATDTAGNPSSTASYSWRTDYTKPVVSIPTKPDPITNQTGATFGFSASETSTYSYRLDGGTWTSTGASLTLSGLSEATHTLDVNATDTAGNPSSTASYSWRTDYTKPVVSIPTKPDPITNQTGATFGFSASETSTYSYRLDGGTWTSTGASLTLSGLSEATHTLDVNATDTAGNPSSTASYSWRTDYTKPVVSIPTKPDPITNQTGATFGFSASETSTYSYRLDGGTWTSTGASLTLSGLSEATHTLDVNATDTAGNPSSTASYSWRTDYTKPVVSIPTKPDPITNQTGATFGFSASETSTYSYRLDGGTWTSTGASLTLSGLSEATHTLDVNATDTAGNPSSTASYSWRTDYTKPVVSIPTKPDPITNQTGATFGFSASETSTYSYRLDGGTWTSTGASLTLSGLSEATHTLDVNATDTAGNPSSTASYSWRTDYTKPVVSIPTKPDPITNQTGATFGFSASETSTYSYRLDGGTWTSTGASLTLSGLSEATHTLDVNATDTAGNPSSTASYSWRTDYTKPVVSIPTKPDPITNQTGATFGFSASETSTYSYRLDGGTWTSTGASLTLSGLSEATHTLDVNATDTAGNPSSTASYSWRTDYTKPVVSIPTKPDPITNQTGATFGFSASETSTYSYRLDGGTWTSTGASLTLSGLSEATHTLDVNATDTAGNPSSTASYSWRTDYTKPVATATPSATPVDSTTQINVSLSSNEEVTYSYSFDGVSGTSTSGTVTLSNVSEGHHTLEYQATDSAGNISSINSLYFDLSLYTLTGLAHNPIAIGWSAHASGSISAIYNQNWGGWKISLSNGLYDEIPSEPFQMFAGGTSLDSMERKGYWLSKMNNINAAGGLLSGDSTLTHLTQFTLGTGTGTVTGSYGDGTWTATDQGQQYTSTPLTFLGISQMSEVLDSDLTYFDGSSFVFDGFFSALMGGTSTLWSGSPSVTIIGQYPTGSSPVHIWETKVRSWNALEENDTTYDGGAYKGYLGGIKQNMGTGTDYMEAKLIALYIDRDGNAGFLRGSLTGTGYRNIGMFEMDGEINRTQMVSDIGIAPENLSTSLWERDFDPRAFNLFVSGTLKGEPISYGISDIKTMSLVDYTNNVAQKWGIYSQDLGGRVNTLGTGTTWSAEMGGRGVFGAYNLDSMSHGYYSYDDGGFYRYNLYNTKNFGYAYYRSPDAGVSYDKNYYPNGQVNVTKYAYGDPYGYGYNYYYCTGTSNETWDKGQTLESVLSGSSNVPVGYTSSSFGPGKNDTGFFINHIEGDAEGGRLTGSVNGRFINFTQFGTISGEVLGNYNEANNTWQAVSLGTWDSQPLSFRSGFLAVPFYFNGVDAVEDGYMNASFGGITSLWGSSNVSATIIGEYAPGYHPEIGHVWSATVNSFNFIDATNTTYDGGAFRGYIGGTTLRNTGTGNDDMEAMFVALYIDPYGNAGFLRSMHSTGDSFKGTGYPGIMMFEMDGTIAREQKVSNVDIEIAPANLSSSIWEWGINPRAGNLFVSGTLRGEPISYGLSDMNTMSLVDYTNKVAQQWGIYSQDLGGRVNTLGTGTTWSAEVGVSRGTFTFGAYNLDSTRRGYYRYEDDGFYLYHLYNTINLGLVYYRSPDGGVGYDKTYIPSGGVNVTNYAYGDPYGYGYKYWYFTGTSNETWNTGQPLENVLKSNVPVGYTSSSFGPGMNNSGFFINHIEGGAEGGRLTGSVTGRFINNTQFGTISGEVLGNYDEVNNTWQAVSLGTWEGSPLAFRSMFLAVPFYSDGEGVVEDGYINAAFGGIDSLWGASSVSATMIGGYEPGYHPEIGHVWSGTVNSYNFINATNTTYDGGAFKGYIGGTTLRNTGTGKDDMEAMFVALYIDPSGNAGFLRSMPSTGDSFKGTGYPGIMMFEMDGKINRTQMVSDIGITPENLSSSLWEWGLNPRAGNLFVSGALRGESISYGISDMNTMSLVDYTNKVAQQWGIYSQELGGRVNTLGTGTTWSAEVGGIRGVFGAYNVDSMRKGKYGYEDDGFYYYSLYNTRNLGYVTYRSPDAGVAYDKTYIPSGGVNVTNYAYGDPYGYGYRYLYFTGTSNETWNTGQPLENVLKSNVPVGYTSSSFGPGMNNSGFFINHIEGDAEEGRLTGSVNGKFINITQLGTISGEVLGNYDEVNNTWQAVSLGTWEGQPLSFRSWFLAVPFYFDGVDGVQDGYINAAFGGIDSLWGASSVSATMIGGYEPGYHPEIGHVWGATVNSYNYINATNTTYDDGAFKGYIGGTTLRNTGTGKDDMEAMFVALYIDPSGNAGFLRSMHSTGDSFKGTGYPGILMFEMDGTIERIEMQSSTGILPQNLMSLIPINPEIQVGAGDSGGVFIDTNYNLISDMLNRGDNLQFMRIQNTNFGIWRMDSFGKFTTEGNTWVIDSSPEIRIDIGYGYPSTVQRYHIIAFGGPWSNNKFTGNAIGYSGSWYTGKTIIIAGETIGTYDDVSKTFSSFSAGTFIETSRFLSMVSDPIQVPTLTSLDFPTTLRVSDVNLSVSTPNVGVNVTNMRIFSPSTGEKIWILGTDGVSGTYGVLTDQVRNLPITNEDPTHPIYGGFSMDTAAITGTGEKNWLGEIRGLGVFQQVDESYIQGRFNAVAAGTYDDTLTPKIFTGSAAGLFMPITFLSEITNGSNTAYLYAFNGSTFETDGYFKGLLGPDNPLTLWSATSSSPFKINMVGLYIPDGDGLTYQDHIFSTTIYPKNFTTNDPDKLYTTTDGGSFKGYLSGIHLYRSDLPFDTIEGRINALYIDPNGNAGVLMGKFGGNEPDYWSTFDRNYNYFEAKGDMYPVQKVEGIGIDPSELGDFLWPSSMWGVGSTHIYGDFGGSGIISGQIASGNTLAIQTQPWGIYGLTLYGTYGGSPSSWSAKIGGQGSFGAYTDYLGDIQSDSGYWLADINGTWGDDKVGGTLNGKFLTRAKYGKYGTIEGDLLGTYNSENYTWQAVALGTWSGDPLTFVSDFYADMLETYESDGLYLGYVGDIYGLMGGTQSLWSGSNIPVTIMGKYEQWDGGSLWYTSSPIYSYNYINGQYTTYDNGAYYGLAGGIENGGSLEGKLVALYIDPSGKAGYLKGNLNGNLYENIGMFEMSGTINRTEKPGNVGISASDLYDNIQSGSLDHAGAYLYGGFKDGGEISGQEDSGVTYAISTQPWGIFGITLYGTHGGVTSSWSAKIGGQGSFGVYYSGGEPVSDPGYWLASIDDGTSNDILRGTLSGKFITYTKLGTISGDLLGKYSWGDYWKAVALGTWDGEYLKFVSDVSTDLYYYDGEGIVADGSLGSALMGGTSSLWAATQSSPASMTMIGYYYPGSNPGLIWSTEVFSTNVISSKQTTYDDGAYRGYLGGTKDPDDNLDGRFVGIYVDPSNHAGYLQGSLSGTGYPNINMFEMDGSLYPVQIYDDIGISPENLYGNIYSSSYTVTGNSPDFSYINGQMFEQYTPNRELAIWKSEIYGSYSGSPSPIWSLSTESSNGSYISGTETTGTQWSSNKLKGTTVGYGADISNTPTTWISVGETLGTYNDGGTWQAVQMGVYLETTKFLELAATAAGQTKLRQLQPNIPCVEVGRANLTGNWTSGLNSISVNMPNTIFFAPNNGDKPQIWATGNVNGAYGGTPSSATVPLSGNGISANFNVQQWNSNKWLSTVNGSGVYNGTGTMNGSSVQFKGAAAGPYGSGAFSGTAAGVAK